ncbi:MAG: hypothetical protein ETSY1_02490 [Candidatus Entotheonella factor]|uniref:Uncharacterized protein n=1 Tax=Entotheonella factor TaxID=1429438 RepID=W4LZD6_ENTF1|nr:hypothetical protein [Candidatus Entotheonella palauensis]ETX02747.1 MAG: hypothetical protein ETSY1_02490 [Candidatus Entotheonella factor]
MYATLAESLDVLLPNLVPTLVRPEVIPGLKALAGRLVPIVRGGFECRLSAHHPQVDLQQCIVADDRELGLLQSSMAVAASGVEGAECQHWLSLQHFIAAWSEPFSLLHDSIPEIWLEFDNDRTSQGLPLPAVFFALPQDISPAMDTYKIAAQSLNLLLGLSGWREWQTPLSRCFAACPDGGFVSHIGVMLSRRAPALRVNVKRLQPDTLHPYLQHIGWPYETHGVQTLMQQLSTRADRITVCLDVGQTIYPRLGFECIFLHQPPQDAGWTKLLDDLVHQGLCTSEKRDALLSWPGQTTPVNSLVSWPEHLIVASLLQPSSSFTAFDRRLSHLKVSWQPPHVLEAKAYLWFQHQWISREGAR